MFVNCLDMTCCFLPQDLCFWYSHVSSLETAAQIAGSQGSFPSRLYLNYPPLLHIFVFAFSLYQLNRLVYAKMSNNLKISVPLNYSGLFQATRPSQVNSVTLMAIISQGTRLKQQLPYWMSLILGGLVWTVKCSCWQGRNITFGHQMVREPVPGPLNHRGSALMMWAGWELKVSEKGLVPITFL